ncbi:hypothetical protein GGF45_001409 [Coemansia sp. RSA 551]|nr:hypothetical protein GGF45_001409 [Coemansia sp. RSA 551]
MPSSDFVDSHVAFLYASQTGNAESICYNIYETAVQRGFNATYNVLDDYAKFGFSELRTIVFVVSTTGDGDPPDNSARFWRILRKATRSDKHAYAHLRYAILGLGDTNYSNFCNTAQRLDKQLEEAGARTFYKKGLADDATGMEEVVEPWIDGLWAALSQVAKCKGDSDVAETVETEKDVEAEKDVEEAAEALAELNVEAADNATSTEGSVEPAPHEVQPLVLDFRPMAQTPSITNVARVTAPVCTATYEDTPVEPHSPDFPPWSAELISSHPSDPSLTPFLATIASSTQMTAPEALKRTLLIDLELPSSASHVDGQWRAGDAFNIYAPNHAPLVRALLDRLQISTFDAHKHVRLAKRNPSIELPAHLQRFSNTSSSIYDILVWSVDLCAHPRKPLLRALAEYCNEKADRERLLFICSRQGLKTFEALRNQTPTVLDVLHAFPSCVPPVERLIELLPPLAPRSYSICNAPSGNVWKIAFNVVEYELTLDVFSLDEEKGAQSVRVSRRGVCTPWLEQLAQTQEKPQILVAKRPNINAFHLPTTSDLKPDPRPVIMIGPGTGVAPFIGFLEQRAHELQLHPQSSPFMWLLFGCRDATLDYLFKSDIQAHVDSGVLTRLSACFSRNAGSFTSAGKYVQDALLANQNEFAKLMLQKNAVLFVCGDAKGMGKDVNDTVARILCNYVEQHPEFVRPLLQALPESKLPVDLEAKVLTAPQALQVLMVWSSENRYVRDLWA